MLGIGSLPLIRNLPRIRNRPTQVLNVANIPFFARAQGGARGDAADGFRIDRANALMGKRGESANPLERKSHP